MNNMIHIHTEKHRVFGSVPFLTTTQPLEEVCIMADSLLPKVTKICKVEWLR